jgi:hypothetical protein
VNRDFLAGWSWRLFMAIGVVILIVGAVMFVRTVRFVAEAEHATGTVVDLSRRSDSEGRSSIRSCALSQPTPSRSSDLSEHLFDIGWVERVQPPWEVGRQAIPNSTGAQRS